MHGGYLKLLFISVEHQTRGDKENGIAKEPEYVYKIPSIPCEVYI